MNSILFYFPRSFTKEIKIAYENFNLYYINYSEDYYEVYINEEIIRIPKRVYLNDFENLNFEVFDEYLLCILTRHTNGYLRQYCLNKIISSKNIFVIPFIFSLIGEYVIEIINDIRNKFEHIDHLNLKRFVVENPRYHFLISQKCRSYWNEYHRYYKYYSDYPGKQILENIDELIKSENFKKY